MKTIKKKLYVLSLVCSIFIVFSCGDDTDGGGGAVSIAIDPAALISPVADSTCSPVFLSLKWSVPKIEGGGAEEVVYDIYLGTSPTSLEKNGTVTSSTTTYDLTSLDFGTRYYWQIVSSLGEKSSSSEIFSFQTTGRAIISNLPDEPKSPNPKDGYSYKNTGSVSLSWECTDIDEGDELTYVVYFGTTSTPSKSDNVSNIISTEKGGVASANIDQAGDYYWQVVVTDRSGQTNRSPVWSFKLQ